MEQMYEMAAAVPIQPENQAGSSQTQTAPAAEGSMTAEAAAGRATDAVASAQSAEGAPEGAEDLTGAPEGASVDPDGPDTWPEPDDETLLSLCEGLRARYPRLNGESLIASEAFRDFGVRMGWDTRAMQAGLPALLDGARALVSAAEPPVSRATGTAASHRRPLLSPHQQRELSEWNRANPQYKMSELDYYAALNTK